MLRSSKRIYKWSVVIVNGLFFSVRIVEILYPWPWMKVIIIYKGGYVKGLFVRQKRFIPCRFIKRHIGFEPLSLFNNSMHTGAWLVSFFTPKWRIYVGHVVKL